MTTQVALVFSAFVFVTSLCARNVHAAPHSDDAAIREIQASIVQQLNQNRQLTAIEQNAEMNSLLNALDADTRARYELWITELREIERERSEKIKDVMLRLSPESQQTFAKILFVQQSETLSQEQKASRLEEINTDMSDSVRQEISDQIRRHEMLKKFLQSRSY